MDAAFPGTTSFSSTGDVQSPNDSIWDTRSHALVRTLTKQLLEGLDTKNAGRVRTHHSLLQLLPPLSLQFPHTHSSNTSRAARIVLSALTYSLVLDYKLSKHPMPSIPLVHRQRIRLLLLALWVTICTSLPRPAMIDTFSAPTLDLVSKETSAEWCIKTSVDVVVVRQANPGLIHFNAGSRPSSRT
jgi:hypothetical protein